MEFVTPDHPLMECILNDALLAFAAYAVRLALVYRFSRERAKGPRR